MMALTWKDVECYLVSEPASDPTKEVTKNNMKSGQTIRRFTSSENKVEKFFGKEKIIIVRSKEKYASKMMMKVRSVMITIDGKKLSLKRNSTRKQGKANHLKMW